jgi:hypothetical protein
VEEARKKTEQALKQMGVDTTSIDLSYITDDLVDASQEARDKREDAQAQAGPGTLDSEPNVPYNPIYYGNHLLHEQANVWTYTNSNPSDGIDHRPHKCGSGYRWRVTINQMNQWGCPNNNPPGGFFGAP